MRLFNPNACVYNKKKWGVCALVEVGLYLEIELFSLFLIAVIFAGSRSAAPASSHGLFYSMLLMLAGALVADMAARVVEGHLFYGARTLNYVFETAHFVLTAITCLYWFFYAWEVAYGKGALAACRKKIWCIPCALLVANALLSPWLHGVFWIDAQNFYHRGPLFAVQMVLSYVYLMASSVILIRCGRAEHLYARRRDYYMLASFTLYPLLGSLLQWIFYGLSIIWPVSAAALLAIYLDRQNRRIATDALTGLNNRGQFDRQLEEQLGDTVRDSRLYLILLDVDYFKQINDTLGHAQGDMALIRLSGVLKKAVASGYAGDFLARYGGDEFAVICRRRWDEEVQQLEQDVERLLAENNAHRAPGEPELQISMGFAYVPRGGTAEELIRLADEHMYEVKRERHRRREAGLPPIPPQNLPEEPTEKRHAAWQKMLHGGPAKK